MNTVINVSEFRNNISDFINRIIYNKESFLIKKGGAIVARIAIYDDTHMQSFNPTRFAGILNDTEVEDIKKNMKLFRNRFQMMK